MSAPNVPFCRDLHVGSNGGDVRAHKRALSTAAPDLYPWRKFSDHYGHTFENAVHRWQVRKGIHPASGKIGKVTHERLEDAHKHGDQRKWAFDQMSKKLATDTCKRLSKTPDQKVREEIVAAAYFWYAHRGGIFYSQARPIPILKPPHSPSHFDCSGFATACHYAAGAPDPNGRGYDGGGYTGTLIGHGVSVGSVHDLSLGDLIFYGYTTGSSPAFPHGSPTHVAVYVGVVGGAHSVISMGHYPMGLYRYDYRSINSYRHYKVVK